MDRHPPWRFLDDGLSSPRAGAVSCHRLILKLSNIDQRLRTPEAHAGSITAPAWQLSVTESVALPPDPRDAPRLKFKPPRPSAPRQPDPMHNAETRRWLTGDLRERK